MASEMKPERHRGVLCIRWFGSFHGTAGSNASAAKLARTVTNPTVAKRGATRRKSQQTNKSPKNENHNVIPAASSSPEIRRGLTHQSTTTELQKQHLKNRKQRVEQGAMRIYGNASHRPSAKRIATGFSANSFTNGNGLP